MVALDDISIGESYRMHVRFGDYPDDVTNGQFELVGRALGTTTTPRGEAIKVLDLETGQHRTFLPRNIVAVADPTRVRRLIQVEAQAKRRDAETNGHRSPKSKASVPKRPRRAVSKPKPIDDDGTGLLTVSIPGRAFRVIADTDGHPDDVLTALAGKMFTQRGRWGGGTYTIRCSPGTVEWIIGWFERQAKAIESRKDRESRNDMRSCITAATKLRGVLDR